MNLTGVPARARASLLTPAAGVGQIFVLTISQSQGGSSATRSQSNESAGVGSTSHGASVSTVTEWGG